MLAARKDAPRVAFSTRADPKLAAAATASDEAKAAALGEYEKDKFSATAPGTRSSAFNTWKKYHAKWFGDQGPDVLPLTVESIAGVLSQLKAGRYRSPYKYTNVAKDMHIAAGYPWSDLLAREMRLGLRSALRGIGPAHQSAELPVERTVELQFPEPPNDDTTPHGFINMIIVADFWVLREVEASLILRKSVKIDMGDRTVEILLPACKTDPSATTCRRKWGCVCADPDTTGEVVCPFHACLRQDQLLAERFGKPRDGSVDLLPFFPTSCGEAAHKDRIIELVEAAAEMLGLPLLAANGRRAFGGHVFRVSGSRHLARLGLDIRVIMLLARWATDIILGYVKDAPLARIAEDYKKKALSLEASGEASSAQVDDNKAVKKQLGKLLKKKLSS